MIKSLKALGPISALIDEKAVTVLIAGYTAHNIERTKAFADEQAKRESWEPYRGQKSMRVLKQEIVDQFKDAATPLSVTAPTLEKAVKALFEKATDPTNFLEQEYESGSDGWNPSVRMSSYVTYDGEKQGWIWQKHRPV